MFNQTKLASIIPVIAIFGSLTVFAYFGVIMADNYVNSPLVSVEVETEKAKGAGSPVANFSSAPKADNPLQIDFTDLSTPADDIAKWKWDFGDGNLPFIISHQQKPEGMLVNTPIELSTTGPTVSGNIIVCRVPRVSTSMPLRYYDVSSNALADTGGLATNIAPNISGDTIAFVTREFDAQMDLNGDGRLDNDIVMYYDLRGNRLVSTGAESSYGMDPSVSGDIIAFVTFEIAIGMDLDGNGLTNNAVVRYFDRTVGKVFNTKGVIYTRGFPLVSGNIIAFPTFEQEYGGDLNGDGNKSAMVLRYFDVSNNKLINTTAEMFGNGLSIFANKIAFISYEGSVGPTGTDLNGDNDKSDFVVRYFDVSSGKIINTGAETRTGTKLSMSEYIIAFITSEASVGRDFNSDGDTSDDVLRYYDLSTRTIVNTGAEIFSNPFVDGRRIAFLTRESSVGRFGADLNGDGDTGDIVLRYFDASTRESFNTGAEAIGKDLSISGNVIAFQTAEKLIGANGLDLNGNGTLEEIMLRYFVIGGQTLNGSTSHIYANPGTYAVTLTVTDKNGVSSLPVTKNITVGQIISPPIASFTASPLTGDAPLTVNFTDTSTNNPTSWKWDFDNNGSIDSTLQNPSHTYTTPNTYTVSLTVSNTDGSNTKTIPNYITVTQPNRNPVLVPIGNQTVNENQFLSFIISAADPDNDPLTYSADNLPSGSSFNPAVRVFSWTPDYTQSSGSPYSVTFNVYDGRGGHDNETIKITVNNVNRPPVLDRISNQAVDEGKLLTFTVNAADLDGDALTYSADNLPAGSSFNPSTRTFSWTPNLNQAGNYSVTFNVTDNRSPLVSETIVITVNDVVIPQCSDGIDNDNDNLIDLNDPGCSSSSDNDETDIPPTDNPPSACVVNPNQTVEAGQFVRLDGSCSFDIDGDPLTYQWTQTSGTAVVLRDSNRDIASFNAPIVAVSQQQNINTNYLYASLASSVQIIIEFFQSIFAEETPPETLVFKLIVTANNKPSEPALSQVIVKPKLTQPTIQITNPPNNSLIAPRSQTTISANLKDPDNLIKKVSFLINDKAYRVRKNRQGTYYYNRSVPYGYSQSYVIQAQARDKQGNLTDEDQITVFTNPAPSISIISPQDNQIVRPKEKITIQTQFNPNNNGITKTEFIIIDQTTNKQIKKQTDRSFPYQFSWTVPRNVLPNTAYLIQARGYSKDTSNKEVLIGQEEIRVRVE